MHHRRTPRLFRGPNPIGKRLLGAWTAGAFTLSGLAQINWYVPNPDYSIARNWNERALEGIRMDTPHPPGQARNLFSFSVCMYDAWAAYDPNAVGFVYRTKHTAADVAAARRETISYAVYRMMLERHAFSRTATNQAGANPAFMTALGYDPDNVSRDASTPAGVGNRIYDAVSAWFLEDGSRQTAGTPFPTANPPIAYPDYPVGHPRRYAFVNPPLDPFLHGINDGTNNTVVDINKWQRLIVANSIDQNGFPQNPLQGYLGAQWLWTRAFSLSRVDPGAPWIDPGPPPLLGTAKEMAKRTLGRYYTAIDDFIATQAREAVESPAWMLAKRSLEKAAPATTSPRGSCASCARSIRATTRSCPTSAPAVGTTARCSRST